MMDDFDDEYLDECSSAICPQCGYKVEFAMLVVDEGAVESLPVEIAPEPVATVIEILPEIVAAENMSVQPTEIVAIDYAPVQEPEIVDAVHVPVIEPEVAHEKVISRFRIGNLNVSEIEINHTREELFEPKEPVKGPDQPRKVFRDVDILRAFFKQIKRD